MNIQLDEGPLIDRGELVGLLDAYLRELASNREAAVGATNAREYRYLDAYFSEAGRYAFVIRKDGNVVGFAFIRGPESTNRGWQIAEFYVEPESRRLGVGRAAIALIWRRFTGDWELQVHARNAQAIQFWTSCIEAVAGESPTITRVDAPDGLRLQFNFRVMRLETRGQVR